MIKFLFFGPAELVIIVLVVLLLFGGRKIPELMKGIGKGIKSFKDEVKSDSKPATPSSKKPDSNQELNNK